MNMISLATAVFMAGPMASPPVTPIKPDPNSYFAKTITMYDEGLDTKWVDVKGSWIGRCFSFDSENEPIGAFFTYLPNAAGPAFGDLPTVFGATYVPNTPADHYDNMSNYSRAIRESRDNFKADLKHYSPVSENPTVSQLSDLEPNNRPDFSHEARWKDNNVIYKITNLITQNLQVGTMKDRALVAAGQVVFACYFYRKVAD